MRCVERFPIWPIDGTFNAGPVPVCDQADRLQVIPVEEGQLASGSPIRRTACRAPNQHTGNFSGRPHLRWTFPSPPRLTAARTQFGITTLNEKDFVARLETSQTDDILRLLDGLDAPTRRALTPRTLKLYRQVDRFFGGGHGQAKDPGVLDPDAVVAAVLRLSTLQDIIALKRIPVPFHHSVAEIFAKTRPPWVKEALETLLHVDDVLALEPLWRTGLWPVPGCDALTLAYYDIRQSDKLDVGILCDHVVWRFFEVDGKGSLSLSTHDQIARRQKEMGYTQGRQDWITRLVDYTRDGRLDRERMLLASLTALQTLPRPASRRWMSNLHRALSPTTAEITARRAHYMALAQADDKTGRKLATELLARTA